MRTQERRNPPVIRGISAGVVLLMLTACSNASSPPQASSSGSPTTVPATTPTTLSDAEVAYCNGHLAAVLEVGVNLDIRPAAVLGDGDFPTPDGVGRDLARGRALFSEFNNRGLFPKYNDDPGEVSLVISLPLRWYSQADAVRMCRAAFENR